jgi:hypothetical protein
VRVSSSRTIRGSLLQFDKPEWKPLEYLIGCELSSWFMWMHAIRLDDGREVHAYKHVATRRYFHLALDGTAFLYGGDWYRPITGAAAIREAFNGWENLLPRPDDPETVRFALTRALVGARSGASNAA